MKINRNSWHYNLIDTWDLEIPNSLCPYFWRLVQAIFFTTAFVFFAALVASSILTPILTFVFGVISGVWAISEHYFLHFPLMVGIGLYIVGGVAAVLLGTFKTLKAAKDYVFSLAPEKPSEPNIILEYLKAVHSKVCPVLEFTDDA